MAEIPVPSVQVQFCQASISCHFCLLRHQSTPSIPIPRSPDSTLPPNPRVQLLKAVFATLSPAEQGAASFAKFSLIGRYLSKSVGTTHVPVQEFALQLFCRHLYQYICYCQYFSLVPLDPRELCERGCRLIAPVARLAPSTRFPLISPCQVSCDMLIGGCEQISLRGPISPQVQSVYLPTCSSMLEYLEQVQGDISSQTKMLARIVALSIPG